jgi:choline kinase
MQAIILAAGMGKRLKELTRNNTKCMVSVNSETLIERVLRQLDVLHLDRIILVVGYKGEMLTQYVHTLQLKTLIVFVINSVFDKTNNIYSLYLAK